MQSFTAPFRMVLRLPQPFKTVFWLAFPAWAISAVAMAAGSEARWPLLPFPVVMTTAGLILALNFRGNASQMIELAKQTGAVTFPLILTRALGVGVMLVGVLFIGLIISGNF